MLYIKGRRTQGTQVKMLECSSIFHPRLRRLRGRTKSILRKSTSGPDSTVGLCVSHLPDMICMIISSSFSLETSRCNKKGDIFTRL